MFKHGTMEVDTDGHLRIGGCDAVELAKRFGTPLILYDEQLIRDTIRAFHTAFRKTGAAYRVAYAVKAFCTIAMCQLVQQEEACVEVVSGIELRTALQAGVRPKWIHMHGNNKTPEELALAVSSQIHSIVVDNFTELNLLSDLAVAAGRVVDVQLRVSPGVEASTHEYIATGQQDSKFGFDLESGQAHAAMQLALAASHLRVVGLHSHIGSQIFESAGFMTAIERVAAVYREGLELGLPLSIFNVGGGFGIRYTEADRPGQLNSIIGDIAASVHQLFADLDTVPEIWVEPGRAIVGNAGTTLYRIGSLKQIPGIRNYVSVDGGMTDNPRYALYGAEYETVIANRANTSDDTATWAVVGKCCESGDVITPEATLPQPEFGEILAVFTTGAYNYSMASHYNRLPHPAVAFAADGQAHLVVRRETWEDVCRNDIPLPNTADETTSDVIAESIGIAAVAGQ